jgi:tetratricopeptide (TPR) repeat protein
MTNTPKTPAGASPWMPLMRPVIVAAIGIAVLVAAFRAAPAEDNRALDGDILNLSEEWARIKYLSKDDDERKDKMATLGARADELTARYPGRAEALIWSGIVASERASLTWGISALDLATRARDTLLAAERLDARALDAAAPTTLGILYYRVPGFPISWGDAKNARRYLEEAVENAPTGREARYYYADFLYEQGEYKRAEQMLIKALTLSRHPERPVWDQQLRKMMDELLAKVREKLKS